MGRKKGSSSSSSSSLIDNSSNHSSSSTLSSSASSSLSGLRMITKRDLSTDLQLGLSVVSTNCQQHYSSCSSDQPLPLNNNNNNNKALFVKVYMEGIPIGRKLDLLAHDGYRDLITTLNLMFNTTILWAEGEELQPEKLCHVLTYEDSDGDWMIVGDVPWEMFLSTVKRLKISRIQ